MFAVWSLARPLRPQFCLPLLILALGAACASVPPAPLVDAELAAGLQARDPRLIADVADLSGLEPLALARPTVEELADSHSEGFWRGCAFAWNPQVRMARRELAAALQSVGAAGKPGAVALGAENEDFENLGDETKLELTFDLLGLLGLEPSRAQKAGARAQVERARSGLERALWNANFEVERARVRLGAAQARLGLLHGLLADVQLQDVRLEILGRRGRLSEVDVRMAELVVHELEHAISQERARVALLRADLAQASGLWPEHEALSSPGPELLHSDRASLPEVSALELLADHPQLRELRSEYALAEAALREIAAQAWPSLRAGPILRFMPSDLILGGLLDAELPWPGSVEPRVLAAVQQRESARERLEDALLAALARVQSLREELEESRLRAAEHALPMEQTAIAVLDAVTRRLNLGMLDVFDWTMRLRELRMASLAVVDERLTARLFELDLQEACGVRAQDREVAP